MSFRRVMSELVYVLLVVVGAFATWYDLSVPRDRYISVYINTLVHHEPAIAFLGGVLATFCVWGLHKLWDIKFRYVLAIMVLGFCLGHLFWSQWKP